MPGECFELPGPDETYKPKLVLVRVVPGQSEETWSEILRTCLKVPGGIAEIRTATMSDEEAADYAGLATFEVFGPMPDVEPALPEPELVSWE